MPAPGHRRFWFVDRHITDAILVTNYSSGILHFDVTTVRGERFPLVGTAAPGETIRILDGSQLSDGAGLTRRRPHESVTLTGVA